VSERTGVHELTLSGDHEILAHLCFVFLLEALHVLAHVLLVFEILFVSGESLFWRPLRNWCEVFWVVFGVLIGVEI